MSRSMPTCRLYCSKCKKKHWFETMREAEPKHFNVVVTGECYEGVECECKTCGHKYVSRSSAAWRRLEALQRNLGKVWKLI